MVYHTTQHKSDSTWAPELATALVFLDEHFEVSVGHQQGAGQGEVGRGARAAALAEPVHYGRALVAVAICGGEVALLTQQNTTGTG